MLAWADCLPDMLARLPGCPDVTAEHALRTAAIAFFEGSRVWKVDLDPIPVAAGQADVDVVPDEPKQTALVRVEAVYGDGRELVPISPAEMDARTGGDWTQATGHPGHVVLEMPHTLRLYPVPAGALTVRVRVSLRPSDAATGLPEVLRGYRRVIVDGAMGHLLAHPNQPWSAPDLALDYTLQFDAAIAHANRDAARAFGGGRQRARPTWC